jgi:hypothetical protein
MAIWDDHITGGDGVSVRHDLASMNRQDQTAGLLRIGPCRPGGIIAASFRQIDQVFFSF